MTDVGTLHRLLNQETCSADLQNECGPASNVPDLSVMLAVVTGPHDDRRKGKA